MIHLYEGLVQRGDLRFSMRSFNCVKFLGNWFCWEIGSAIHHVKLPKHRSHRPLKSIIVRSLTWAAPQKISFLVDTTSKQVGLLQSFLDCIVSVNANLLSHLCINFLVVENIEDQSLKVKLRQDGRQSLRFLQEKCANLTTLETFVHSNNSSFLAEADDDNSQFVREEALLQFDAQLKAISLLKKIIVRVKIGTLIHVDPFGWHQTSSYCESISLIQYILIVVFATLSKSSAFPCIIPSTYISPTRRNPVASSPRIRNGTVPPQMMLT